MLQTSTNMILGYPALVAGKAKPLWTQAEYAIEMNPTLVIVELGYYDVLEPAVNDDPSKLPDVATFRMNLSTVRFFFDWTQRGLRFHALQLTSVRFGAQIPAPGVLPTGLGATW